MIRTHGVFIYSVGFHFYSNYLSSRYRVGLISQQNNFARIRKLTLEYGLKNILPENLHPARLIRYIIDQDRDTSLQDALTVVGLIDGLPQQLVYSTIMDFLVKNKRVRQHELFSTFFEN